MYSVIRLTIGFVIFLALFVSINRFKLSRKRLLYLADFCISALLVTVLMFLPFENAFATFDSPEKAYNYFNFGKSNDKLVIDGNSCDLVVDSKDGVDQYLIIPKTEDGWKIGIGSNTRRIAQKLSDGIIVYVYQYKNTNDCFLKIFDTNGGESTITDEYNTEFFSLERYDDSLDKKFVTYYAHITEFNTQYSVIVNGIEIALNN